MAIQVMEFKSGDTKLERFLPKNKNTLRKLLNFDFKIDVFNNVNNKKCAPKLVSFSEKNLRKIPMIFDIENQL
jgi:hypothetical protein